MSLRFTTHLSRVAGIALALTALSSFVQQPFDRAIEVFLTSRDSAALSSLASVDYKLTDDAVRRLGREAYVWGWPLVFLHNCRQALEYVPAPGRSGGSPVAPPNSLCMLTSYINSAANAVACPNHDVVYGFGVLDLEEEPVVLQVPEFGERYWLFQLGDQRTDGFASVGKMYGTKPGLYLITGPRWQGALPAGFAGLFRCPTRLGYCLPRVYITDDAADREAALPVLRKIMMYPLSRYQGAMKSYDWTRTRWYPRVGSSNRDRSQFLSPEGFFDVFSDVLAEVPPLAGEAELYRQWHRLMSEASRNPRIKEILVGTAVNAEREVVTPLFDFHNFGTRLPHYWSTVENGGDFQRDYLTRAAVARSNIFVNRRQETLYFYLDLDGIGRRLNGKRRYQLTFAPDQIPAVEAFWSLTLYNQHHAFHPNTAGRHSLGSDHQELNFNRDGSLTIYIQAEPPDQEHLANWLPAPEADFSLYLRAYWPKPVMLERSWALPAVVAIDDRPESDDRLVAQPNSHCAARADQARR